MQKPSLIRSAVSIPTLTDRDGRTWTQGHDIQCTGVDPENNLEGANSEGLGDGSPPAGSRGGAPVGGLGNEVPQKLTTFRS